MLRGSSAAPAVGVGNLATSVYCEAREHVHEGWNNKPAATAGAVGLPVGKRCTVATESSTMLCCCMGIRGLATFVLVLARVVGELANTVIQSVMCWSFYTLTSLYRLLSSEGCCWVQG